MLPFDPTDPFTKDLKANPDLWKEKAVEICQGHSITVTEFTPFAAGCALVAAVSKNAVIKIIQPPFRNKFEAESWALSRMPALSDSSGVEIPRQLFANVTESGWSYIIMTRVAGIQLDHAWPEITEENRKSLMYEIGKLMAYVHDHAKVEDDLIPWQEFLRLQKEKVIERHQKLGLPDWFVDGIPEYLKTFQDKTQRPTLLTGEYTPFNLLVKKTDDKWKLSGMIDFADSFPGNRFYDLIGPGVFLGAGKPDLVKSLLDGYGVIMTDELRHALMSLHLLHRFSHFDRQVALPDWKNRATNLKDLAQILWP